MKKKVIVTGAAGFIGAGVVSKLVSRYDVVAVVSPFSRPKRLNKFKNSIAIVRSDLSSINSVGRLIKKHKPFAVIHLASHGIYPHQQKNDERIVIGNYLMTYNLLKHASANGVQKFINAGSVSEYGSKPGKLKEHETSVTDVLNKYSAAKIASTALVNSYADKLNVITLRLFTAYGPGEDDSRFVVTTVKRALKNEPLRIIENVRDFVYIEDIAYAFLKALKLDIKTGDVINIGSGKGCALREACKIIKDVTGSKSEIVIDESYKRFKESKSWADISRAKKVLGWSPKVTMFEGIKKMVHFIQNEDEIL